MNDRTPRAAALQKASREILEEINYEVSLVTQRLSTSFLSDVFRAIFSAEKSVEMVEPRLFALDDDPSQMILERLSSFQLENLPFAIMNDEVLCKNYKLFSDIDFVVFADLSLSMLYRWSLTKDVLAQKSMSNREAERVKIRLRKTKLYALKYLCCTFLYSATNNAFRTIFLPYSSEILTEMKSRKDLHFPALVLHLIDDHFRRAYDKVSTDAEYCESSGLANALTRAFALKKRSLVLLVSDFLDDIEAVQPSLSDLKLRHSLLVAVINDPYEVQVPADTPLQPLNKSWEHTKDIEKNIRQRAILTNENIKEYNRQARERRERLFSFLRRERIHFLDIVTDQNHRIPEQLGKLNFEILEGF